MIGRAPLGVRVAVAGLAALAIAYPLRVAMVSPQVSLAVRAVILGAFVLSALRPAWRVPLLAGGVALAPIGPFIFGGVPRGIVHLLVASIALPWMLDVVRGRSVWPAREPVAVLWSAWLLVGAFSVGVALLAGYRLVFEDGGAFLLEWHRLASQYVFFRATREIENWFRVWTAMADGLCAYLLVRAATDRDQALRACMAVAIGVAAFGVFQAATGAALLKSWSTFDGVIRIHSTFADPNALGAWLAMCLPPVLALAMGSTGPRRSRWLAGAVVVSMALLFTGSRAGWGGALIAVAWLAWRACRIDGALPPRIASMVGRSLKAASLLGAVVLAALIAVGTLRDVRQFDQRSYLDTLLYTFNLRQPADEILKGRLLLWRTAGRMVASKPAFGVGLGRSEREFYSFSQYIDPRKPPGFTSHNTFLTVASETGLLGLTALLVLLTAIGWVGHRSPPAATGGALLLRPALAAGVLAFVVTMITGDRLLLREDVVMFGLAVGLLGSYSAPPSVRTWNTAFWTAGALAVFLVVSTPWRAAAERQSVQLDRVWHGVSAVLREPDDTAFRWTAGRATFFVPGTRQALVLPLRRGANVSQQVTVRVNGRDADRLVLDDDGWREVRYALPGAHTARQFHRVEIETTPLVDVRGQDEPVGVKVGLPRY